MIQASAPISKLTQYSRWLGQEGGPHEQPQLIVLVPPMPAGAVAKDASLAHGFERARQELGRGQRVRLIAHGATVEAIWPAWVANAEQLTLTELGAYRIGNPSEQTRPLAAEVHAWLDDIFNDIVPNVRKAGSVFYSSSAGRFLQPLFEALPYAEGLSAAHPGATFHCIDPEWAGLLPLDRLLRGRGGRLDVPPRAPKTAFWAPRLICHVAYRFLRACAGQMRNFARAAPSRQRLKLHRRGASRARPTIWMAMVPDWKRINRHLVDGVAGPALQSGETLGVLLVTTLLPGERLDDALGKRVGTSLWPALDLLGSDVGDIAIDQIVGPESLSGLASLLLRGARQCLTVAFRLARAPPLLSNGPLQFDLSHHLPALAAVATTDVLQALAAAEAAATAHRRYDFGGSTVVFAALNYVETASAAASLSQLGATTVDFVHGAGGDGWYGSTETSARFRAVWTHADAQTVKMLVGTPLLVKLPGSEDLPVHKTVGAARVLVLSHYVHIDTAAAGYPLRPFQAELVDAVALLAGTFPQLRDFRWRPHPCDDEDLVARDAARYPFLIVSTGRVLADDLQWADIVISSASSTVPQALLTGAPVFVHVHPALRNLEDVKILHASRTFFYAKELAPLIEKFLRDVSTEPQSAMAAELSARAALFGEAQDRPLDLPAALAAA